MNLRLISYLALLLLAITACEPSYIESKKRRVELAKKNQGDIVIGIAWSSAKKDSAFVHGAQLAVEEINNSAEDLFKTRKLKLVQRDDTYIKDENKNLVREQQRERNAVIEVANAFVADPNLVAVIGHRSSLAAIPASVTYQYHGVVFLAPTATNLMLTNHQFEYVFRLMPSNQQIGEQLVNFCEKSGYERMAVLYERNTYAEELSKSFIGNTVIYRAGEKKELIKISFVRSFFAEKAEFSSMLAALKEVEQSTDAIFIATSAARGGELIRQVRGMDIKLPIIGADAMHSKELWIKSQEKAQGTVVPALLSTEEEATFLPLYEARFPNEEPDYRAALGYDAIKLLAYIIKRVHSAIPIALSTALRYAPPFEGVIGGYRFDEYGNLKHRRLHFKMLCNGSFEMMSMDAEGRYTLENCESPAPPDGIQDRDRDGIPDEEDMCPNNTVKEISEGVYQKDTQKGCPLDSDQDGIPDYKDKCQATSQLENLKGVDEKGCPLDSDQDGIPDYEDECPDTPPAVEVNNQGCSTVEELQTYTLSSSSQSLFSGDELTDFGKKKLSIDYEVILPRRLEEYIIHHVEITGYTDNRGSEEQNLKVSEARAQRVADFFIEKGVSANRITVRGKGEEQPIDTNETEKGRANNRRIEVKISVVKKKTSETP